MKINRTIYRFVVLGLLLSMTFSCKKDPPKIIPTITTTPVTNIDFYSVTSGGTISSDGGSPITASGICWSLDQYPTLQDHVINSGTVINKGDFKLDITGLNPITTYYIRAFATNSVGTAYGNTVILSTKLLTMTDVEGNVYHTVTIGTQIWTVENLKTTKYRNGEAIPNVTDNTQWYNLTTGAYVWHSNDKANKSTYGALYNWYAVIDSRKITPVGWHIPSDAEWDILSTFLGGVNIAGGKLSETGIVHWINPNTEITNETGFTALPGGMRSDYGSFWEMGLRGYWWSSTENYSDIVWLRYIAENRNYIWKGSYYKKDGFSVRCIKDN